MLVTSCPGEGDGDGQGPEAGPRHQAGARVQEEHHLPGQGSSVSVVLQKVPSEANPKVCNHGEVPD